MSWQLGAFGVLAAALAIGFAWYERERPDARIVALVGTLAAFAALGRIAFAAVPNVKPTTDIVLVAGYALGGAPGFAVGALAALTSNFFFGQGPWTPWQMAAWGATGIIGAGLARLAVRRPGTWSGRGRWWTWSGRRRWWTWSGRTRSERGRRALPGAAPPLARWPLAIVCCAVGFAFTVVQDVGDWVSFSDHSRAALGVYVGQGLGFDAVHAAGCLAFALVLGPALTRSIQRFALRTQVTWLPAERVAAPLVAVALALAALGALGPRAATAGAATAHAATAHAATAHAATAHAATAHAATAHAATAHAAVTSLRSASTAAANYLLAAENADGGFGPAPGQPSDQLYTGWAALGLAAAGHDLNLIGHTSGLMDYVRAGAGTHDVGALERTILVVRAAGLSARSFGGRDLIASLERRIRADGSISGQVNLTAFAVLALRADGVGASSRTLHWLARQQDRDGGFSFSGAGGSSDVDDTGAALEALAGAPGAAPLRSRAIVFLRRQQNHDGGFPSQSGMDSNAQSTAWAIQGLDAAGVSPTSLHRDGAVSPLAYLDALVAGNGAVRYSRGLTQTPVWVTGEAVMAMEGKPLPVTAPPPPASPAPAARSHRAARHAAHAPAPAAAASAAARTPLARAPAGRRRPRAVRPRREPAGAIARSQVLTGEFAQAAGVLTALVLAPVGLG